jgi:hypothetical protein
MQPTTRGVLLQDVLLVAQDQDFGFQPLLRLEAAAQHAKEQEANCYHAAIMIRRCPRVKWMQFSEATTVSAPDQRPSAALWIARTSRLTHALIARYTPREEGPHECFSNSSPRCRRTQHRHFL